ncbi:MAG: peptide-methionine (S)-S-oxide reductase MsrA [Thaumarchaeota archaeon]|nr:peptide-methionine (S)-S-oxide reductase MsrA [Nitrososphaerota archaeon]
MEKATFGAGCFWHVEDAFMKVNGVKSTKVGYMGGSLKNPTYKDVCTDMTGHAEVVQVEYDPSKLSYEELLDVFWSIHDPTTMNRQGPDIGTQYRSAIFVHNKNQEAAARASKTKLQNSGKSKRDIVTAIEPALEFYKAEEYHQQYYEKQRCLRIQY